MMYYGTRVTRLIGAALLLSLTIASASVVRAASTVEGVIRVNQVVVEPASSLAKAEASARRQALEKVLAMQGGSRLDAGAVRDMLAQSERYVSTRLVLNKAPVGGLYQPAFYFDVDVSGVRSRVQVANTATIGDYGDPRIQVAMVLNRLPREFDTGEDRQVWVTDLATMASEYYNREGFSIVGFTNVDQEEIGRMRRLSELEDRMLAQGQKPVAVDYYLMGEVDAPEGSVRARDGGAYFRAKVKLMLHFWDFNSGQVVSARRDVEGTGEDAREALDDALRNVVKAISQKANAPDVIKRWKLNIQNGMTYEITFCEGTMNFAYFEPLKSGLETFGSVSGSKSDQIPLHEFRFPGGRAVDPAKEFDRMLKDIQTRTNKFSDTQVQPVIYNKHKVFMFGNVPNCFGGSGTQSVGQ